MTGIVIKDSNGLYYCGLKKWDKQLRNAKIYVSKVMAVKACALDGCKGKQLKLVKVHIEEIEDIMFVT